MRGRGRLGAVLAGGRSSRFGSDKRQARFHGKTLLFRAVEVLSPVCDEVVVVGGGVDLRIMVDEAFPAAARSPDPESGWVAVPDVIPDRHRGIGPLGGLHAALVAAREREMAGVIALGCDMPLVTSELLSVIAREGEATDRMAAAIPRNTGPDDAATARMRFHPLCTWYSADSLPLVESRIRGPDHSLHGLLHALDPYRIPGTALAGIRDPELMLRSANTTEELRALELPSPPGGSSLSLCVSAPTPPSVSDPATSGPALRARGLHRRFGDLVAVKSLDLEIRRGECFGLLGPNGAGKTTTIELLEGLQRPDGGDIEILGMRWDRDARRIRPRLGIQLQETRLTDKIRVEETIRLFRSFYPSGPSVEVLIDRVQLHEKRRTFVRDLSGGQRQRLSIACALAGAPDILFLDEPTSGLDPQSRRALWDICEAFRDEGGTILLTTHFMDEAERLSDRVAIMDHGEILVEGTPAALISTLGGAHVIEFEPTIPVNDADLTRLPGVRTVKSRDMMRFLAVDELHRTLPALITLLERSGGGMSRLQTHRATLDDVFLARTGRQLRDE